MTEGKVLEFRGVTKLFGDITAVSDFTARVEPGAVTGFVGPNGAGKSTTLRILLGEIRPTQGAALIGGVPYARLSQPRREVGAVLENVQYRPRRTATRHLHAAARQVGIPATRVAEVLDIVGLTGAADMRIGGFSFGMRQRLGVAEALLGDPGVLIFDEPANGLDPEGIRWIRLLMRRLADEGRTVLMSSHVLSEVEQVADDILIISQGRLLFSGGIEKLADIDAAVTVDSPDRAGLSEALRSRGIDFELKRAGFTVPAATTAQIGGIAAEAGIPLSTLQLKQHTLEDVYIRIIDGTWTAPAETTTPAASEPTDAAEAPVAPAPAAEPPAVDEAGAQVEPVDELFAPATVDSEVAVDEQPLTDEDNEAEGAPADAAPAASALHGDPLAFLRLPLPEVEKDVVAGEAELIAASLPGEQPTPGWLPTPSEDEIPHPAAEDADDPDPIETADTVIDLPDDQDFDSLLAPGDEAQTAEDELYGTGAPAEREDVPGDVFDSFLAAFRREEDADDQDDASAGAETQDVLESIAATESDSPAPYDTPTQAYDVIAAIRAEAAEAEAAASEGGEDQGESEHHEHSHEDHEHPHHEHHG